MHPRATNQAQDGGGILPVPSQGRLHRGPQFGDARVDSVGEIVLEGVPELFAGVQLGAVGRQINEAHPRRQPRVAVAQVEPGLVADEDVDGLEPLPAS